MFTLLHKIGNPPQLFGVLLVFHDNTKGIVQFSSSFLDSFMIESKVKQGCVLVILNLLPFALLSIQPV